MDIQYLDSETWNNYLEGSIYQTAFHNAFLIEAFVQELGGKATLCLVTEGSKAWLTPVFQGCPWNQGEEYFSTSSVGYGGPLALHRIVDTYRERLEIQKCLQALEIHLKRNFYRGTLYPFPGWVGQINDHISETLVIVQMNLNAAFTFGQIITGNARTAIRRAKKSGVTTKLVETEKELDSAFQLILNTQRSVSANYATPYSLIQRLHVDKTLNAELRIAVVENDIVGAVMLLKHKIHSFHWLHGWDKSYGKFCGNQLLIWSMMQTCMNQGCPTLNLGASHTPEQKRAKERWGAVSMPILNVYGKQNLS